MASINTVAAPERRAVLTEVDAKMPEAIYSQIDKANVVKPGNLKSSILIGLHIYVYPPNGGYRAFRNA